MIRIKTVVEGKFVRTLFNPHFGNWITIWESQSLDSNSLSQAAATHLRIGLSLKANTNDQQRISQAADNEPIEGLENRKEDAQEAQVPPEIGGDEIKTESQATETTVSL